VTLRGPLSDVSTLDARVDAASPRRSFAEVSLAHATRARGRRLARSAAARGAERPGRAGQLPYRRVEFAGAVGLAGHAPRPSRRSRRRRPASARVEWRPAAPRRRRRLERRRAVARRPRQRRRRGRSLERRDRYRRRACSRPSWPESGATATPPPGRGRGARAARRRRAARRVVRGARRDGDRVRGRARAADVGRRLERPLRRHATRGEYAARRAAPGPAGSATARASPASASRAPSAAAGAPPRGSGSERRLRRRAHARQRLVES
jgi:hypothetical protein